MEAPWVRARKTKHQKQEERLGKEGKPQINSGRTTWRSKRDASLWEMLLVEARTTQADSISISKSEWLSMRREANQTPPGLLPGYQLEIQDLELLVLGLNDARELFMELQELQERVRQLEYREASPNDGELPEMFEAFQADPEPDA